MGSGLSKHPDEQRHTQAPHEPEGHQFAVQRERKETSSLAGSKSKNDASPSTTVPDEGNGSGAGCPMKRSDGSYSWDWSAMLRPSFPHGPAGRLPLKTNTSAQTTTADETGSGGAASQALSSSSSSSSSGGGGGCPVKHNNCASTSNNKQQAVTLQYNVYGQPIAIDSNTNTNPANNMPAIANQLPAPGQSQPLSTTRIASTIPKGTIGGDNNNPTNATNSTWLYPSPQMFYNALARKGKLQDTTESDIDTVVALHNLMNEMTWQRILEWEQLQLSAKTAIAADDEKTAHHQKQGSSAANSKLLKFVGRPVDLSPKAAFKHYALGHPLPFDRHDWTVLRSDGTTVRYVIDYYHDESRASDHGDNTANQEDDFFKHPRPFTDNQHQLHQRGPKSLLVDVRPAADTPTALWQRFVTMPLARHIFKSTSFQPLPLFPTVEMKSQVQESVQVWQSIQKAAQAKRQRQQEKEKSMQTSKDKISEAEALRLKMAFSQLKTECRQAQLAVNACESEADCARASLDLTLCMGKITCPLQHDALVQQLTKNNNKSNNNNSSSSRSQKEEADDEEHVSLALERLAECVQLQSEKKRLAQDQFPHIFS